MARKARKPAPPCPRCKSEETVWFHNWRGSEPYGYRCLDCKAWWCVVHQDQRYHECPCNTKGV